MEATISSQGLTLPKRLFKGMSRVRVSRKQGVITIVAQEDEKTLVDPLFALGSQPSDQNFRDGSVRHDDEIYSGR